MRGFSKILAAGLLTLLGGCAAADRAAQKVFADPPNLIKVPFNPSAAQYVLKPGTATVRGRVGIILDGALFPGDSSPVHLIPVTEYSQAVMAYLFRGEKSYFTARPLENPDPRYKQYQRHTLTGADSTYTLLAVPPGDYFLYATVAHHNLGIYYAVQEHIIIAAGQNYTVDLDGQ